MKTRIGNNYWGPVGARSCHSNTREAAGGRRKQGNIQDCIAHSLPSCSSFTLQNVGSSETSKTPVERPQINMQIDQKNVHHILSRFCITLTFVNTST